ncbi:MAG: type II secretion system protein [Halanaerobiales bacterium]
MFLKFNNVEGFTLLDTLIAMVILGISLSILVEGYLIVTDSIQNNRNHNYIITWSESKMSQIINGTELARHGSFEYMSQNFNWRVEEKLLVSGSDFKIRYLEGNDSRSGIGEVLNQGTSKGLKEIQLIVEWNASNGIRDHQSRRLIVSE